MAAKKTSSKKKAAPRFFEQTDLALCLATIFTTLSILFVVMATVKYL